MSIAQTIQRALSNVGDVDQQREVLRKALDHKVFAEVRPISWNMWKNLKSSNDILQNVKVGL
jgi:2-phosphoglycerate kinase